MTREILLRHFDRISDTPDAIPRLRKFVLDLAIRGRLVRQDQNDEPVSELLRCIQAEKARRLKEGGTKTPRKQTLTGGGRVTPLNMEGMPFEIPSNWVWAPFGQIVISRDGDRIPVSQEERNSRAKTFDYYGASGIIDKIDAYLFDKPLLLIGEDGANLINRSTPIAFIARGKYWVNNHAHVLDGISEGFLQFIELYINAIDLTPYVTGTAQPKMNQAKMNSIPVALPPEAEQHRIVAKVDELMALCDRLEAAQRKREIRRDRLAAASVHHLNTGANAEAVREHAHFYINHLPAVTVRREQINQLRQTIRNLAIRGQLAPQNPKDEPASKLLQRIVADKVRLLREGKINKQKPVPPVGGSVMPFDLPTGWIWTRLGELSSLVTSGSRDWAKHYSKDGAIFVRMGNLSRDSYQLRLAHIQRVSPPTDTEGARTKLEEGDILISITGEVGLLGLIPQKFGDAYINQHTCLVRPMERLRGRFLPELFCSPFAQHQFDEPQRGLKNSFRLTDVTNFLVPLPPLAEQHRIVGKLDELMGICDRLEAQLINAQTERSLLLESVLHDALQSGDHVPEPQRLNATA